MKRGRERERETATYVINRGVQSSLPPPLGGIESSCWGRREAEGKGKGRRKVRGRGKKGRGRGEV